MWNRLDVIICLCVVIMLVSRLIFHDNSSGFLNLADADMIYTVAAGTFSVTAWFRALYPFTLLESIGPLIQTLRQIPMDILNYAILEALLVFGFFFALRLVLNPDVIPSDVIPTDMDSIHTLISSLFTAALTGQNFGSYFTDMDHNKQVCTVVCVHVFVHVCVCMLLREAPL